MTLHVVMAVGPSELVDISVVNTMREAPGGRVIADPIYVYEYEVREGSAPPRFKRGFVNHQRSKGAIYLLQQVLNDYDSEYVDEMIDIRLQNEAYEAEAHS